MKTKLLFILILFIFGNKIVNAQLSLEDSLQTAFFNAQDDTAKRNLLEQLMNYYIPDTTRSPEACYRQMQTLIAKKGDPKLEYLLPFYYIVFLHTPDSIIETQKYLDEFIEQCRLHNDHRNYVSALMIQANNKRYTADYDESLKMLLLALDFARDTLRDKEMVGGVFLSLAIFYYEQKDTLQAIEYNKMALKEMTEINHVDNMASVSNNLALQYSDLAQYDSAEYYFRESIRLFHISVPNPKLRNPYINLAEVFRLTHNYDSSVYYTRFAIQNAIDIGDGESLGSAYWQIAKTYRDLDKPDSATKYFQLAMEKIEMYQPATAGVLFYPDLAGFYASMGNHKSAYEYLQKAIGIKDLIFNEQNNKVIKEMDVKYQASQKEKEILKQEEQIKRQKIVSNSIMAVAAVFLLLIFFVYRGYRQKQKANIIITHEKKRSDELLLNILPAEVAEELKQKGSTEAKQFNDVTVMFTDFKNFSQISEKLSPAELVAEIHTCFKAFDHIIGGHNIEKIKTIGDSYMCAGGLPVANTTNAIDVVSAAMEIQKFMQQHVLNRKNEGKEVFEIRIGIHTGPVVAGIVGVKKFAYDIWGDTVNIASRMESSGEAGKLNISGSTYQLVKDKFKCVHRGKIQAKNKGELDMYFVDSSASEG